MLRLHSGYEGVTKGEVEHNQENSVRNLGMYVLTCS